MKTNLTIAMMLTAGLAAAQVVIPDGTKIRVRLESNLSSETAELGQQVDFAVTQEVRIGDAVVIANGARATGNITLVEARRRFARGGKLDFSIDRVQTVDGNWLDVRYTTQKNRGKGNGLAAGVFAAGLAVVFVPAAPLAALLKGHEATVVKGHIYEVFANDSLLVANAVAASVPMGTRMLPQAAPVYLRQSNGGFANNGGLANAVSMTPNPVIVSNVSAINGGQMQPAGGAVAGAEGAATLAVSSNVTGADIEVDGMFVGNTPTSIQLPAGVHNLTVRSGAAHWTKDIQITSGTVTINANLAGGTVHRAALR